MVAPLRMRGARGRGGRSAPHKPARRDRASRSASQVPVEEAATEEQEEPVAGAAAAPGKLPPLGKEDLVRLVERFGSLGFHLPRKIEKLKPEDARIMYNQHLHTWGLVQRETPHARGPIQPRVFVSRPPMENVVYHMDLSDAKLRALLELPRAQRGGALAIWASAEPAVNAQVPTLPPPSPPPPSPPPSPPPPSPPPPPRSRSPRISPTTIASPFPPPPILPPPSPPSPSPPPHSPPPGSRPGVHYKSSRQCV